MDIPAPFDKVFEYLNGLGYALLTHGWTSDTKRHYQGTFFLRDRVYHAKMKALNVDDYDDYLPEGGLWRMVWGDIIVKRLRQLGPLPFDTTTIVPAPGNINFGEDLIEGKPPVAWVVTEFNDVGPFVSFLPGPEDQFSIRWGNFIDACHGAAKTWLALRRITWDVVKQNGFASMVPQYAPYQALGAKGVGLILAKRRLGGKRAINSLLRWLAARHQRRLHQAKHHCNLCLGLDAFELKNFLRPRTSDAVVELVDTETWYWYNPLTMLAKFFIRLWVNDDRPDLAATFLQILFFENINDEKKWQEVEAGLVPALRAKIKSGEAFDKCRRGLWAPTAPANRRRQQLTEILSTGGLQAFWHKKPADLL